MDSVKKKLKAMTVILKKTETDEFDAGSKKLHCSAYKATHILTRKLNIF